ncbi:AfsR/SARP family transcriptional regulator [Streptomyces sp. NPDC087849]|uniref:AfsR/SARP family transcriptional regulator n=1 Tax=Streptomyces sp. NPDC087849 TaxID=3365808 RepID=UPI003823D0C2
MKTRCVLAVLVHAHGEPVSMEALIDRVWGDEQPETAVGTMQSYVSRLRRLLREAVGDLIQVERPSPRQYQLRVDASADVDVSHFQRLREEARVAAGQGKRELAIGLLRAAEARWRSEPLPESTSDWAASVRGRLVEDLRRVREERIGLELELGRHADLVGELHELASENPLAQQVIASLMLALYRSGRHDEALALFRTTRDRLREGLGIEPGPDLQELHRRILEQDRTLMETAVRVDRSVGPEPRSNLPRDSQDFTGRVKELRVLLGDLAQPDDSGPYGSGQAGSATHGAGPVGAGAHGSLPNAPGTHGSLPNGPGPHGFGPTGAGTHDFRPAGSGTPAPGPARSTTYAMPLTVIHGMPGIGKTALAVHAAHRLHAAYPGGQLYVDLHGFSGRAPYDPGEALAVLLHAAGATGDLPDSLDERAARWREWTARHRVLVVLDNARDAAQVRPLLPGAATCRAIVTSRNRLAGLDGASSLLVEVLSNEEGAALFTRIAGATRVSADPEALERVTRACGCHPLRIQLLASRFRHRESWNLHHLLDRLAQAADPLDEFDDGELVSVFRFSYTELTGPTQKLLRHLALHPGPDITVAAATALVGASPDGARIRRSVDELHDFHLLEEPTPGRYRLHDLTRAFALRMFARTEPEGARAEATGRLLGHYLTTAHHADRHTQPRRRRLPLGAECTSAYATDFCGADDASLWLAQERPNLLAVARTAAAEAPVYAALFPHVLAPVLKHWGTWAVTNELYGAAVHALRARGAPYALAQTLVEAADVLAQTGHNEALSCASEALALFRQLGHPHGCADALFQAGRAHLAAGRGKAALNVLDEALAVYRQLGDREGEADALNVQGAALSHTGQYGEALSKARVMLAIYEETGNLLGQIHAQNNLGECNQFQGRYEEALAHYERSLALAQQHGGRQELDILDTNLGAVYQATGQTARALACFRRSLESHRAHGDALGEVNTLINLGALYTETGRTDEALTHFRMAEDVARRIDNGYEYMRALLGTADAHRASEQFATASQTYEKALEAARRIGSLLGSAQALAGLARTALGTHRWGPLRRYGTQAVALYRRLEAWEEADGLRRLLLEHPEVAGS